MKTLMITLVVAAVAFVGYAVVTHYRKTPADDDIPKRVWASLVAAAGVIGAALMTWVHGWTAP